MPDKASDFFAGVFDISNITFEEEGEGESARHVTKGMTLAVGGKFIHPWSGEVDLSDGVLNEMKRNHDKKVLGTDVAIDERHDRGRALGWIKPGSLKRTKVTLKGKDYASLSGDISWTPDGRKLLEDKSFKYFSPEFGTYTEPDGKTIHENVLLGGALTNRPFLKMLPSIKFDEGEATNVMVLDEGGKDEELWEVDEGKKKTAPFNAGIKNIGEDVKLEEIIAKAKEFGLDVKDEAGLVTLLQTLSGTAKENAEIKTKLTEAGVKFDDKTSVADVVVGTLGTFMTQMQTVTTRLEEMTKANQLSDANVAVTALITAGKILGKDKEHYVKLFSTDQALFESLTSTLKPVVMFGEIGGPGITFAPGSESVDMREFQDPLKAEEAATTYLEKFAHLTPKSKTEPKKFSSDEWQHGRRVGVRT
jgi:Mu-like prophage I protein